MLPLSTVLLLVLFPATLIVAAQGAGDLPGFTFPAVFDPTGEGSRVQIPQLPRACLTNCEKCPSLLKSGCPGVLRSSCPISPSVKKDYLLF